MHELEQRLRKDLARTGDFNRNHPMPASGADVPDDLDARLVVLSIDHPYSKEGDSAAEIAAKAILETRGNSPRLYRNTLVFLPADMTRLQDLDEAARKVLAWESILAEQKALNLSPFQVTQAENQKSAADSAVTARLPETYQWLLVPVQAKPQDAITWEALRLTGSDALAVRASKKLRTLYQRLRLTGFPISTNEVFRAKVQAARLALTRHYNSIFSNELSTQQVTLNYPNSDPDLAFGGAAACGYFAINPSFYCLTRSPVAIASAPDYPISPEGRDAIPGQLRFAGTPFMGSSPQGPIVVEYDALGLPRSSSPTIGPLEATSLFCAADFNRDDVVDFFDYLDFANAFANQQPVADFNADSVIDLFDYLDFVAAFAAGC